MPTRKTRNTRSVVRRRRRPVARRKRGGSICSWIKKKAIPWVRRQHLLSRAIGPVAGLVGGPMAGMAAGAVGTALGKTYGFGRRLKRCPRGRKRGRRYSRCIRK